MHGDSESVIFLQSYIYISDSSRVCVFAITIGYTVLVHTNSKDSKTEIIEEVPHSLFSNFPSSRNFNGVSLLKHLTNSAAVTTEGISQHQSSPV